MHTSRGGAWGVYYTVIGQFAEMPRNPRNIRFATGVSGENERQLLVGKTGNLQLEMLGESLLPQTSKNSQKRSFRRFAGAVRRRENLLLFSIG